MTIKADELTRRILDLRAQRMKLDDIARLVERGRTTVKRHIDLYGDATVRDIDRRIGNSTAKPDQDKRAIVMRGREEGSTLAETAKVLGVSESSVGKMERRMGLPRRLERAPAASADSGRRSDIGRDGDEQ